MGKLEMKNLTKTFNPGTVNEKTALSGLSLTVEDGDFITIVGSNGAGKSTLFHAIAGVFYVDGGSIVLDGEDITYKPEYRRSREMGRLFQDPMRGTAPHMTIEENLALAYLRTAKHQNAFFSRTSKADRAFFRDQLARLDMGLEAPAGGVALRWTAPGSDAADVYHGAAQGVASGRAHRRSGPGHCREGAGDHQAGGPGAQDHHPDGDPQHAPGPGAGQPHPDDGSGTGGV